MSEGDEGPERRSPLAEQASEIIDEETDWIELAENLDVSRYRHRDAHADWHAGTPFSPMFLAYLWATVEGEPLSSLPDRLSEKPNLARAFGFDPEELPSESTFRPVRIQNRFNELESTVDIAAEKIRNRAAECGAPIGYLVGKIASDTSDDSTPSKRTLNRMERKKCREVMEELDNGILSSIWLPRPDEAVYEKDELLAVEAIAAIQRCAANQAGENLGDKKNPNPDYDDPFYEDGPSGEVLLEAMKEMSVEEIAEEMNFALRKTYTRAKPRLRELESENGARFGTKAKVALDITYVAYHGEREEMEWVQGTPPDKGYEYCHKFATAVIVGENTHYTVGVCPLGSTEFAETEAYAGEDNSYYIGDVARRLLSIAEEFVNIRTVYADREFHATDVIFTLEAKGLNYVIPAVKHSRIKRLCGQFDHLKRGYHEERDTPMCVEKEFPMYGSVKGRTSNTRVYTTVVILPPDEDDETHEEGSPQPFLTNLDVGDEIALDRRWTKKQMEGYSDRAAIENSYSSIKKAAAWTTSKEFEVRWFHFAFGCIIYNLWLLVDFLVQERIGVVETRSKPRIKLQSFLNRLDDEVITLI